MSDSSNPQAASMSGFAELGISGLTRFGAISRVYDEFLRELVGPQGMKSYREMADNDPIAGAIIYSANHLCRKARFKVKPANSSKEAAYIADKIGSMLFDDMESTWPDTVSEILTMLPFGWSLMEFTMKRRLGLTAPSTFQDNEAGNPQDQVRFALPDQGSIDVGGIGFKTPGFTPSRFDDGLIGFKSWNLRAQETLYMWEFDDHSNALVMQQMAPPDYKIRRIPLSKSLLFRTQSAKNNPEGRSILRNAWTSYYFKKNLQVFEGIGIERDLAGYPVITTLPPDIQKGQIPPDIYNTKDVDATNTLAVLKKMVKSIRRDEQEGMVLPWWAKLELMSTGSRRSFDTNAIIGRYDQRIAMSVMADFIMLGHEAVGSKALAATKMSLYTASLSSFLDTICTITNRHALPTLCQFNGWPQELCPTMGHTGVENVNLEELGGFIQKVAGTGFNPLATKEAQDAVMEVARLPVPNDKQVVTGDGTQDDNEELGGRGPLDSPHTSQG